MSTMKIVNMLRHRVLLFGIIQLTCCSLICVYASTTCDNPQSLPPLVTVTLKVNASLKEGPFLEDRTMSIPEGFAIELYARVPGARHMLLLPNGDVLVSQMNWNNPPGTVAIVRRSRAPMDGEEDRKIEVSTFADELSLPHGLALVEIGNQIYVYISESTRVMRYPYSPGDTVVREPGEIIVNNLPGPNKVIDEVNFKHPLKNIAVKGNSLFVTLGSNTNDEPLREVNSEPKTATVYRYDLNGGNRALFAKGVRNAMALDFDPRTGDLWAVVNQRDFVKYPYRDATGNYGMLDVNYADKNPPEQFIRLVSGADYGWPYCNPVVSETMDDLDFVTDVERNADETEVKCSTMQRTNKGLNAHSAPLGLSFWTGDDAPVAFKDGAVIALHGSGEDIVTRTGDVTGNKVVFFPFKDGRPGPKYILVDGFSPDKSYAGRWGRPVATLPLPDGSLLISDDHSGSIYRLYQNDKDGAMCLDSSAHTQNAEFVLISIVGAVTMFLFK